MINPITRIDGYKLDHRRQYPTGTTNVYSNLTARSSRLPVDYMFTLGLQAYLQRVLIDSMETGFFRKDKDTVLKQYKRRVDGYLGPNQIGTQHIADLHDLGYIPLRFYALPEGTKVPLRVPCLTLENTLPEFFWVTNYIESDLSNGVWLPSNSATIASIYKKMLVEYAKKTVGDASFVPWQGHDFSYRGMGGFDAAMTSGMGHLLFFTGTDTIPAMDFIEDYYGVPENYLLAGSVAATEHSVMCAGGDKGEMETYIRLLELYPEGFLSVVSDTWDYWNVLTVILPALKAQIMARNGKLVIRPDSGDPVKIICGDPDAPEGSSARKGTIQLLWEIFGGTTSNEGYKVLDSHIGAIYGDSITTERAREISERLMAAGFATINIVYGIGSFTYQFNTRDTLNTAMKATSAVVGGICRDLYKAPKTDSGMKTSARGRLAVILVNNKLTLIEQATPEQEAASLLLPTWENGKFLRRETYDVIRTRADFELWNR